jgi:hypothetical protein
VEGSRTALPIHKTQRLYGGPEENNENVQSLANQLDTYSVAMLSTHACSMLPTINIYLRTKILTVSHNAGQMLTEDAIPQNEHTRISTHSTKKYKSKGICSILFV